MALDKEKIKKDADLFIQNGQFDKALVEYQKLVVLEAGSPDVHVEIAQLYEKLNEMEKASQEYVKAGRIYERANQIEKALELYEKSFNINSRQKDLYKKIEELKESARTKEEEFREEEAEEKPPQVDAKEEKQKEEIEIVPREDIKIPLFSELNEDELHEILSSCEVRNYKKDDVIVNEGEKGDSIFFIISGEVGVFKKGESEHIWLNTLRDGEFFGEFAFFSRQPRQASVIVTQDSEVLGMKRDVLEKISEKYPNIINVLTNFYKVRVLDTVIGLSPVFNVLQPHQRKKLLSKFELSIVPKGKTIIEEGTEGTGIFLIKDGRVKLVTKDRSGKEILIGYLKEFDFFGEVSLVMNVPTTASIIAETEVRLMKLSRENFKWLLDEFPFIRKRLINFIEERAENTAGTILKLYREEELKNLV